MSEVTCPSCGYSFTELETAIKDYYGNFEMWVGREDEEVFIVDAGHVTLVQFNDAESDSWGYNYGPTSMVFKVINSGETTYWRKEGTYESYNGREWDGSFTQVQKRTRTSYYYE